MFKCNTITIPQSEQPKKLTKKPPPRKPTRQTTIERLADGRYFLGWDEAASHQEGGKTRFEFREMYRLVPGRYGDIYKCAKGRLAWHAVGSRICARMIRERPKWLRLDVDCEGEAIFSFPTTKEKFEQVARWAKCRRRPYLSADARARLSEQARRNFFQGERAVQRSRLNDLPLTREMPLPQKPPPPKGEAP